MYINLYSLLLSSKLVNPPSHVSSKGAIVNLASISSFIGQEMEGASTFAYNITKAGALQLTKSLASRYAAQGIRVNCVCPGNVETNIIKHATPEEGATFCREAAPAERIARQRPPEEGRRA